MKVSIRSSGVKGRVSAPPSKSYTIRGLMCAALAGGESEIIHPLVSDDTRVAAGVLRQVGVGISESSDHWQVSGGILHNPEGELFCEESAATLRFMTAIGSLVAGGVTALAYVYGVRTEEKTLAGDVRLNHNNLFRW